MGRGGVGKGVAVAESGTCCRRTGGGEGGVVLTFFVSYLVFQGKLTSEAQAHLAYSIPFTRMKSNDKEKFQ